MKISEYPKITSIANEDILFIGRPNNPTSTKNAHITWGDLGALFSQMSPSAFDTNDIIVKAVVNGVEVFVGFTPAEMRALLEIKGMDDGTTEAIFPELDPINNKIIFRTLAEMQNNFSSSLFTPDFFNIYNPIGL